MPSPPDATAFIRANLPLKPVPSLPQIVLHTPTPGSGLGRYLISTGRDQNQTPYWAYSWAGGLAMCHHLFAYPELVRGKRVLDLGSGSGLVGIAGAQLGAEVTANEIDPHGRAAIALNMQANNVTLTITGDDLLDGPPPDTDLILAGDLQYEEPLASRATAFLSLCQQAGIACLMGSPKRRTLPADEMELVAEYIVPDFADTGYNFDVKASIYSMPSAPAS